MNNFWKQTKPKTNIKTSLSPTGPWDKWANWKFKETHIAHDLNQGWGDINSINNKEHHNINENNNNKNGK